MVMETVGVVGLGKMGLPIAAHIKKAGFKVLGYDVVDAARQAGSAEGITISDDLSKLARESDLVIIFVAYDSQVEEVLFTSGGLVDHARPTTIFAVGSTIAPSAMLSFAKRLAAAGFVAIDIPNCRGEAAAKAGTLLITGGGEEEAFERCRPVLEAFSDSIHRLGPAGAGQVGKMINNLTMWACISINAEAAKLASLYDMDLLSLRSMLLESSAQNWALRNVEASLPLPWAEKDMMMVLDEADKLRLSVPLSGVIKEVIKAVKIERGDQRA